MITTKLITRAEIQQYKQLSNSIHDDKLNQIIVESQFTDLQPLLGERLFNDIQKEVEATNNTYDDLLDGGIYTYKGVTYTNVGLKAVLASYIYARYAMFGDVLDNPFGMTQKLNVNESKPIDYATKKTFFNMNQNEAYNLWLNVEKFLIRTNVELFKGCQKQRPNTFKIGKVG